MRKDDQGPPGFIEPCRAPLGGRAAREMHNEGHEEKHEEHKEDNLRYTRCGTGNTSEAEGGRDQRDYKKG